jgi:protein-S-isoprenylcysteine O-methyltransferase Ste14
MPPPVASAPLTRAVAWLGGACFVAALATGAWHVGIVFATPAPGTGVRPLAMLWNVLAFTIFAAHHSVMARTRAKDRIRTVVPPALERSLYVWVASLLFIALCLSWQRVPGVLYTATGAAAWALHAMQATGVVFTLAGARVLDGLELAGIRQVIGPPRPADIRIVWPFTVVRHPIYLGWALLVFGVSPMTVDRLLWALVSTFYLAIAMPWEERSLSAAAGPAYSAYCRRVRWRMVPGLY